tara:strand:+ start:336 stop:578 length:243 start_codon:yes stop_codon:yes gene_type:complete
MNDKEKLKVLKHYLEETYKDSREYLDEFYEDCKDGEVDNLEWLEDDNNMDDWCSNQPIEYIRIYDYALMEFSRRLLKMMK